MRRICMLLIVSLMFLNIECYSEGGEFEKGKLFINDILIEAGDPIIKEDNGTLLFPLRTIFESLGAVVTWQKNTGNILIDYNNEIYECLVKEPRKGINYIYIKNQKSDEFLYLTPMSHGGGFKLINDRTYLFQEVGVILMNFFEFSVEVNYENQTIKLIKK